MRREDIALLGDATQLRRIALEQHDRLAELELFVRRVLLDDEAFAPDDTSFRRDVVGAARRLSRG